MYSCAGFPTWADPRINFEHGNHHYYHLLSAQIISCGEERNKKKSVVRKTAKTQLVAKIDTTEIDEAIQKARQLSEFPKEMEAIKEMLEKQLQLLFKRAQEADTDHLIQISGVMAELGLVILRMEEQIRWQSSGQAVGDLALEQTITKN
nr:MAG TPA: hypothetical protein [Caudoviricetes sp.]